MDAPNEHLWQCLGTSAECALCKWFIVCPQFLKYWPDRKLSFSPNGIAKLQSWCSVCFAIWSCLRESLGFASGWKTSCTAGGKAQDRTGLPPPISSGLTGCPLSVSLYSCNCFRSTGILLIYFSVNARVISFWFSLFNVSVHWAAAAYALSGLASKKPI